MIDLQSPAVREAGARALYVLSWQPADPQAGAFWDASELPRVKQAWYAQWDRIAAEIGPVLVAAGWYDGKAKGTYADGYVEMTSPLTPSEEDCSGPQSHDQLLIQESTLRYALTHRDEALEHRWYAEVLFREIDRLAFLAHLVEDPGTHWHGRGTE